jgi:hypothetical protein
MRNKLLQLFFLTLPFMASCQKYLNKYNVQIGASPTFIFNSNAGSPKVNYFKEWTFAFNVATSIHSRIQIGVNSMTIFHTDYSSGLYKRAYINSLFSQYSISSSKKFNLYAEGSLSRGNYCTCGLRFPYQRNKLNYLGMGLGMNYKLTKSLYLDFGFNNYIITNQIKGKYNFTQYIIGLNYIFNFRERVRSNG